MNTECESKHVGYHVLLKTHAYRKLKHNTLIHAHTTVVQVHINTQFFPHCSDLKKQ